MTTTTTTTSIALPGASKPGYVYTSVSVDPVIKAEVEATAGTKYLTSFVSTGLKMGVALVNTDATKPTMPNLIGVKVLDPISTSENPVYVSSIWAIDAAKSTFDATTKLPTLLTYTFQSGSVPGITSTTGLTIAVLPEFSSTGSLLGVYVPTSGNGAMFKQTVTASDSAFAVKFDASVKVMDEDLSITGSRLFFDGEAGPNISYASAAGSNQVDLINAPANFDGGSLVVEIKTAQSAANSFLRVNVSGVNGVFQYNSLSGALNYSPGKVISGSNVESASLNQALTPSSGLDYSATGTTGTSGVAGTATTTTGTTSTGSGVPAPAPAPAPGAPGGIAPTPYPPGDFSGTTASSTYIYKNGDPVSQTTTNDYVRIATVTAAADGSKLTFNFNDKATADIVELLLSQVALGVLDKTTKVPTQDWDGLPATVDVQASLKTSASSAAVTFDRYFNVVSHDETSSPDLVTELTPLSWTV
jgi:hypothetical protein